MTQAAGASARQSLGAGRLALSLAQGARAGGFGPFSQGARAGERLSGAPAAEAVSFAVAVSPGVLSEGREGSSMAIAARAVDDSDGKKSPRV
jgi:hypothetical protein